MMTIYNHGGISLRMEKQEILDGIRKLAFDNELEKVAVSQGAVLRSGLGRVLRSLKRMSPDAKKVMYEQLEMGTKNTNPLSTAYKALKNKTGEFGRTGRSGPEYRKQVELMQQVIPKSGPITMKTLSPLMKAING